MIIKIYGLCKMTFPIVDSLLVYTQTYAPQGSQENITILCGLRASFFVDLNLAPNSGGSRPGVILTERATVVNGYRNRAA